MSDASKRLRPDDVPVPDGNIPADHGRDLVNRSTLDSLFDDWKKEVVQNVQKSTESLFKRYDSGLQKRFDKVESDVHSLSCRMADSDRCHSEMQKDIDKLKKTLDLAENADTSAKVRQAIDEKQFDREIDPTIIDINAEKRVGYEHIKKTVVEWLDQDFKELFKFLGESAAPTKNVKVQFTGNTLTAATRVDKALRSLRSDDGTWTRLVARDEENQPVKLFEGPDKSKKQIRTEMESKRLRDLLRGLHPAQNFHVLRREGIISSNWKQLARVIPVAEGESVIEWNYAVVAELEIDREAAVRSFRSSTKTSTQVQWRV